jgi:hypothetical protein
MGATKAKWRGNQLAFYDSATYETTRPIAPRVLIEDFEGDTLNTDKWLYSSTANEDTQAVDGGNAVLTFTGDATQQESGVLAAGNSLDWDPTKGLIYEARLKLSVLPTSLTEAHWGFLGEAQVDDKQICSAEDYLIDCVFTADGSGIITINCDDNVAGPQHAVATGVTVLNTEFHVYRIDITNIADIKFYIDGVGVATGTTFTLDSLVADTLQPVALLTKNADAGLGTMLLDYIKVWQATR